MKKKFYNPKTKCLYDVIGDGKIRPNQLFALSLNILSSNKSKFRNCKKYDKHSRKGELLNNYGLKTLAKGEEKYIEVYEGDPCHRDTSYHQGITWPSLLGFYYTLLKNIEKEEKDKEIKAQVSQKIEKFKNKVYRTFKTELEENGCIGSISELYKLAKPQLPGKRRSNSLEAWSVARFLE